ncbi:MAG: hypothetical protein ACW976_06720 [Candidatus Ranarchaeia archaeon]|jgi:hypothetical protein
MLAELDDILMIIVHIGRLLSLMVGFIIKWPIALWQAKRGFRRGLKKSQTPKHIQEMSIRLYIKQLNTYRFGNLFKTIFLLRKDGHI